MIQALFPIARLVGTTNHATSYEPRYLLLHLRPIHIPLKVSHGLPYTKVPCNLGGVSLSNQRQMLTFRNILLIQLVELPILQMVVNSVVSIMNMTLTLQLLIHLLEVLAF